ncbi:MAG: NAD(P)H-dependent oxidoreductase subunit E [Oscillospiraceae bacterium]|nr:NAD(P)H-dependent oxidoreductase subunit E [Oscillospiraceae bacterium]
MAWNLTEAMEYYKKQGAPADQNALISLLREIQQDQGSISRGLLPEIAAFYGIKETFLLAVIRRIPRLRLADTHILELCAGPNCGKATALAAKAEALCAAYPGKVTLKFTPCMRMCGKGPNLKFDGRLYHQADEALLEQLLNR